jgi:hypothetical protein
VRDLRLQQIKEPTKRLISNETSQDRSIRLNDANRFAAKISNETCQERYIRLENAKRYAVKKSSEASPERLSLT